MFMVPVTPCFHHLCWTGPSPLSRKSSFFPNIFPEPYHLLHPFSIVVLLCPIRLLSRRGACRFFVAGRFPSCADDSQFCPLHIPEEPPDSFVHMCDIAFDCCEVPCYFQVVEIVLVEFSSFQQMLLTAIHAAGSSIVLPLAIFRQEQIPAENKLVLQQKPFEF